MPVTVNGFQRVIVNGIPVWKNSLSEYFAYELDVVTNPIQLGSETDGFNMTWKDLYKSRLESYQASLATRVRAGQKK